MIKDGYEYTRFDYLTRQHIGDVAYRWDKEKDAFIPVFITSVYAPYQTFDPPNAARLEYTPNGWISFQNAEVVFCDDPDMWLNVHCQNLHTRKKR